jgi:hypothetical protein
VVFIVNDWAGESLLCMAEGEVAGTAAALAAAKGAAVEAVPKMGLKDILRRQGAIVDPPSRTRQPESGRG